MNLKIICVAVVLLLMTGCAKNSGQQFLAKMSNEEISSKLIKNQTSKAEVKSMFGDPAEISFSSDGQETWEYSYTRSADKGINYIPFNVFYRGTNDNVRKLKIRYTFDGFVDRFSFSNSQGETQIGLFQ